MNFEDKYNLFDICESYLFIKKGFVILFSLSSRERNEFVRNNTYWCIASLQKKCLDIIQDTTWTSLTTIVVVIILYDKS